MSIEKSVDIQLNCVPKCERAEVVPECAPHAQRERRGREVVLLVEGPVPGGEGARHHQLLQGREEEEAPQQHEQVEQLGKNLEIIRWHPCKVVQMDFIKGRR